MYVGFELEYRLRKRLETITVSIRSSNWLDSFRESSEALLKRVKDEDASQGQTLRQASKALMNWHQHFTK